MFGINREYVSFLRKLDYSRILPLLPEVKQIRKIKK